MKCVYQLAYLNTPRISISFLRAVFKGTVEFPVPDPTITNVPPQRVAWKEKNQDIFNHYNIEQGLKLNLKLGHEVVNFLQNENFWIILMIILLTPSINIEILHRWQMWYLIQRRCILLFYRFLRIPSKSHPLLLYHLYFWFERCDWPPTLSPFPVFGHQGLGIIVQK